MASKEAYIQKLQAELDRLDAEIARLKAKAAAIRADARLEYESRLEALQRQRATAEEKLGELRHAAAGAWEDMTVGVEAAWSSLRDAVGSATRRFAG